MPKQAETLQELAQVRADNRRLLNMIVGSQGTALGRRNFTPDGETSQGVSGPGYPDSLEAIYTRQIARSADRCGSLDDPF